VTVLTVVHGVLARYLNAFGLNRNAWPERYFRILNEVPTVLMIAIVALVMRI
jgi:protoporphyrinogen IX oxidase